MGRLRRGVQRVALLGALGVAILTAFPLVWLAGRPPVGSAFMLRSRFEDPAAGRACERVLYRWVDWKDVSPFVPRAIVLAEDQRFLEHDGFDFRSIERALRSRENDGRVRGASTITQQLAKNLFLWPGRSWIRKGIEAWYTAWMEVAWPKRRILELYLNVAQFGPCVFGVEAAAGRYFDVSAAQLTAEQAALLAAVLPNPARLRAHDPGPHATERAREVLELLEAKRDAPWLRRL
ncbi:MAG: monofunctional biosynthetic peptidoglycan transglycosylase [Deltaproteobacteria bacterium]|nr:monofunctional biosynthetic peptidoglycan transglycosylase [Deltaproteobacteria bacterium]MBW2362624.1 monofunctional biosynthetic peptidoglycan transglycosylase [Deltaproteobacteria bacterium]